jgi:hypothetical protein
MVRFRAFDVRFMPPTNTLGAKLRLFQKDTESFA